MDSFKKYKRSSIAEIRSVTSEEIINGLKTSISIPVDMVGNKPKIGDMVARNPASYNDQWLITKEYFSANFEPFLKQETSLIKSSLNFGDAIEALKLGNKVARTGWNGKGIFIELQVPTETSKMTSPYIFIDTTGLQTTNDLAPKSLVPWLASQTDMLANDWRIV
jgi:hypothetical protein